MKFRKIDNYTLDLSLIFILLAEISIYNGDLHVVSILIASIGSVANMFLNYFYDRR
jgi:hypothetical protein